jgi:anti-sigma regulatory factor (Ser/Thr protein kinase)
LKTVFEEAADLRFDLPCDQMAPSAVRHALEDGGNHAWVMGDLMLVASELVTNAVLHSGCIAGDMVSVEFELRPDVIVCAVSDPGRSGTEAETAPVDGFHGGFGLRVVEELAHRWGHERQAGGRYRVWAELARAG